MAALLIARLLALRLSCWETRQRGKIVINFVFRFDNVNMSFRDIKIICLASIFGQRFPRKWQANGDFVLLRGC